MKKLTQAQRHKVAKAPRGKTNSVPLCLSASVPNNNGLTLLEIAISLAILSIAFVALATLFPLGLKSSRRATNFSGAGILAQRVIENIKRAAAVYDINDRGVRSRNLPPSLSPFCSDGDGIGYFELIAEDTAPYTDESERTPIPVRPARVSFWKYQYPDTDMYAIVTKEPVSTGAFTLLPDKKLKVKVYVAVYWKEADKDRADTFITYIANPFYEKYK